MTEIFDGRAEAARRLEELRRQIELKAVKPRLVSFYFAEDPGSVLYTRKKGEAAASVGIEFHALLCHLNDTVTDLQAKITQIVTKERGGVMIQKPTRKIYEEITNKTRKKGEDFAWWWEKLVTMIPPERDVDCLSPVNQEKLDRGEPVHVLPATVQAVLDSLEKFDLTDKKILINGYSDLLGRPLSGYWRELGNHVTVIEQPQFEKMVELPEKLTKYDVIVSATGQSNLITGEMIREGAILVDVGEPGPDIERASVTGKAAFLTPVPGGIGPMTIASLLENALILSELDG